MSSPQILTYAQVLDELNGLRHLLLGNGFSIACRPDLFRYDALFDRADFTDLPRARRAFTALGTKNFEAVIRALRNYALLSPIYSPNSPASRDEAAADADELRDVLVNAVADSHPDRPHNITDEEYRSCRNFVRGYSSLNTLNYDLLLYWALMQDDLRDGAIPCDDGFRKPAEDLEADYVSWDPDNSKRQNIRYLHGALHLYDTGSEMKKFTWINSQIPLIEQVRNALDQEFYPVFVSEGTSAEKVDRIRHNDYLSKMYRSFTELKGDLVVFGNSLDRSDDHVFVDRIGRHGKTSRMYISIFGDPSSNPNAQIIRKALTLPGLRRRQHPLEVKFYDAASTHVWS